MTDPKFKYEISGDDVNIFMDSLTWVRDEQIEKTINIVNTDGLKSIEYADIDNVSLVLFKSDSSFKVTITAGGITSETVVNNIFIFDPEATYWSTVTDISISTDSITAISVNYRIYGATS